MVSVVLLELIIFFGYYFFGGRGLPHVRAVRREIAASMQDIAVLEKQIAEKERELSDWHAYPFYKEKIMREDLQFINPGDIVYFVP